MLFQIIFSVLFLLPLIGTLSVLVQAMKSELSKKNAEDQQVSKPKVIGYSVLTAIGLYFALFLLGLIWIPGFDFPYAIKVFSFCLTAPYLFGVIGISFALKKVTEAGSSPSKMVSSITDSISEG